MPLAHALRGEAARLPRLRKGLHAVGDVDAPYEDTHRGDAVQVRGVREGVYSQREFEYSYEVP